MVAAHAIWWIWVNPANTAFFHMAIARPTPDWGTWRSQWEHAHLARFFLQFIALTALVISVIWETPV